MKVLLYTVFNDLSWRLASLPSRLVDLSPLRRPAPRDTSTIQERRIVTVERRNVELAMRFIPSKLNSAVPMLAHIGKPPLREPRQDGVDNHPCRHLRPYARDER